MTLGRRLAAQLLILLGCLVLTAGVGLWSVRGTRQDFSVALANFEKLRQVYRIALFLQSAQVTLATDYPNLVRASLECRKAQRELAAIAPGLPLPDDKRELLVRRVNEVTERVSRGIPASIDESIARLGEVEPILAQQINQSQVQAEERKAQTLVWLAAVASLSLMASVLVGIFQWRSVMRPLTAITAGVKRIGVAKFDAPIKLQKADREFHDLARDFNHMADQLESAYGELQHRVASASRSLVQSERLAGVGMLAAGVAHEINNPLAIITGRIELLMLKANDESVKSSLKIALDEAFRCKQIIDRLLSLSRGPSGKRAVEKLDGIVGNVVGNVRSLPGAGERMIVVTDTESVSVSIDEGEIKQVILNLLINAIQATPENGRIDVSLKQHGMWAELVVTDNGRGMDQATLDRLFEPFFSARPSEAKGTGLGLSISKAIIESHGGTLEADSNGTGTGSQFCVRLPVSDASVEQKPA